MPPVPNLRSPPAAADGAGGNAFNHRHGLAGRFEPGEVERFREQRPLMDVDQMSAPQVATVEAATLHDLRHAVRQRLYHNGGGPSPRERRDHLRQVRGARVQRRSGVLDMIVAVRPRWVPAVGLEGQSPNPMLNLARRRVFI